MKKLHLWIVATMVAGLACCGSAPAATTVWLSTSPTGTAIAGNTITVEPGANLQLYAFMSSDAVGNVLEAMVGYDTSDATTHGASQSTNHGANKKLTLVSAQSDIQSSMDASHFGVLTSAVMDASGRETSNVALGGRPYGFVGRLATTTNAAPGQIKCFAFTVKNNMTSAGDYQYIVLSNTTGGNSYSTAWKSGTSLYNDSTTYNLNVVCGSGAPPLQTVGTANKNANSTLMSTAASKYNWVFWGVVSARDSNGFTIDDGSGAPIKVLAAGNTVANGNYVSVKGSLDISTNPPTLTSQQIN